MKTATQQGNTQIQIKELREQFIHTFTRGLFEVDSSIEAVTRLKKSLLDGLLGLTTDANGSQSSHSICRNDVEAIIFLDTLAQLFIGTRDSKWEMIHVVRELTRDEHVMERSTRALPLIKEYVLDGWRFRNNNSDVYQAWMCNEELDSLHFLDHLQDYINRFQKLLTDCDFWVDGDEAIEDKVFQLAHMK